MHHNLYTEVKSNKRGPKTAAINLGSQVDMKYTSMSNMDLHKTHMAFFHTSLKVSDLALISFTIVYHTHFLL